jgi:GT2 family glycosyltransferase
MSGTEPISVVIVTFGREEILLETVDYVLNLRPAPSELIVVDQTKTHTPKVEGSLARLHGDGRILWIRTVTPSIPKALNRGLAAATEPWVLFLDDDVIPSSDLVSAHVEAQQRSGVSLVAGQVLQPWDPGPSELAEGEEFRFSSIQGRVIDRFPGGNCSVDRETALRIGGMDENFLGAAYRFENDFALRLLAAGGEIWFEPSASVRHLRAPAGGTRAYGDHLRSFKPHHAVGEYYFLLKHRRQLPLLSLAMRRLVNSLVNRHHLRRPWWLAGSLVAELSGLVWATTLLVRGPKLLSPDERMTP